MRRGSTGLVVFAALTIIGFSASGMRHSVKRKATQRKQLEVAQQNWEAEGGAVLPEPEDQIA